MKLAFVLGTRPEIIKLAPLILEAQRAKIPFEIYHTNQHYSPNMDEIFFDELQLPRPNYNFRSGDRPFSQQLASMMTQLQESFSLQRPDLVFVQGDTNSVLAGALVASHLHIPLAHVEAGLRSYDNLMQEELNRKMVDHVSKFLFAVSEIQVEILKNEGINENQIFQVGNTIVDACLFFGELSAAKSRILEDHRLTAKNFVLFTAHRQGNVDTQENIEKIRAILNHLLAKNETVIFPIHPRTKANFKKFQVEIPEKVIVIEPQGYYAFLRLIKEAKFIVTDSGGVQEEACILKTPCITIRDSTERPETLQVGANILVGLDIEKFGRAYLRWTRNPSKDWANPFGEGDSAKKILEVVTRASSPH